MLSSYLIKWATIVASPFMLYAYYMLDIKDALPTGILTSKRQPRYSHHAPAASTTPSTCMVFSLLSSSPPGSNLSFNDWYFTLQRFPPKSN